MRAKLLYAGLLGVVLLGSAYGSASRADATGSESLVPLRPYKVEYLTKQFGLKLKLLRELAVDDRGQYTLTEQGSIMLQKISQKSQFRVEGLQLQPQGFVYNLTGVVRRQREVQFPEDSAVVRSLYKGDWYDFERVPGMLDRLSQQEQVRLFLLNDPTPEENLVIKVVDGRKTKDYELVFVAEEALPTSLGRIDTLHFRRVHKDDERSTDVWLAPQWDYLMVRTLHVEDGSPVEAVITGGSIDGVPLSDIDA
jgi:hypothetical protein